MLSPSSTSSIRRLRWLLGSCVHGLTRKTDHFVVHFRMSEQGRLTMTFAALYSTDTVTANLTVKLVLILVCIFGCLCEVAGVFLFLPFRTQVAVCTAVSLFRIARDLRSFPGSTFLHFRFLFLVSQFLFLIVFHFIVTLSQIGLFVFAYPALADLMQIFRFRFSVVVVQVLEFCCR